MSHFEKCPDANLRNISASNATSQIRLFLCSGRQSNINNILNQFPFYLAISWYVINFPRLGLLVFI